MGQDFYGNKDGGMSSTPPGDEVKEQETGSENTGEEREQGTEGTGEQTKPEGSEGTQNAGQPGADVPPPPPADEPKTDTGTESGSEGGKVE